MSDGNNMQRLFDVLAAHRLPMTIGSIERHSSIPKESIRAALRYLISQGYIRISGSHNARLYALKDGVTRPEDRRGGPRRTK